MRASLVVALALVGCSPNLKVPTGAEISCTAKADCPNGYECNATTQRCVSGRTETLAPSIVGTPQVSPPDGGTTGTSFTVSFEVSEPLKEMPRVSFGGRTEQLSLVAAGELAADQTSFVFTYLAQGESVELEGANGLVAQLVDRAGNQAQTPLGASLLLDFSAPRAVAATAQLTLPRDPLMPVTSLGAGVHVRLILATDEPLADDYEPVVRSEPAGLSFDFVGVTAAGLELELDYAGGTPEGVYALFVTLADRLGNEAEHVVPLDPPLLVDLAAPPPPVTASMLYERVPWGRDGESKSFHLSGGPASAAAGAVVLVFDDADADTAAVIGRTTAATDGSLPRFALNRADQPSVYIGQADGAGNLSSLAPVQRAIWTASLAGKRSGDLSHNPLTIESTPLLAAGRQQGLAVEITDDDYALLGARSDSPVSATGTGSWLDITPNGDSPAPRGRPALTWDPITDTVILFGGAQTVSLTDMWRWDDERSRWTDITGPGERPVLFSAAGSFPDPVRGSLLTVGFFGELWEWRPGNATWAAIAVDPDAPQPSQLSQAAWGFDSRRGKLFFAQSSGAGSCELWDLDSRTGAWTDHTPAQFPASWPVGCINRRFFYDAARDRLVLFGLRDGDFVFDVWDLDPATDEWSDRTAEGTPPDHSLSVQAATLDTDRDSIWLFSTPSFNTIDPPELWEWRAGDGSWTLWTPADVTGITWPSARSATGLVYNPRRHRMLLFGGRDNLNGSHPPLNELWEWRVDDLGAGHWRNRTPTSAGPEPRYQHGLIYDEQRQHLVLFGGIVNGEGSQDMWSFDGRWQFIVNNDLAAPYERNDMSFTYDPVQDRYVLFRGNVADADLWWWQPDEAAWHNLAPVATWPDEDHKAAYAYDPVEAQLFVFGGSGSQSYEDATWLFGWTSPTNGAWASGATGPSPRRNSVATYDSARQRMVVFSGESASAGEEDETWEWNGADGTWALRCTTPELGIFDGAGVGDIVYDPVRERTFHWGGVQAIGSPDNVRGYEYDGVTGTWSLAPALAPPPARLYQPLVYDESRQAVVMVGGRLESGQDTGDVWLWDGGGSSRPALVWHVPWQSTQAPNAARTAIHLELVAGGRGAIGRTPVDGAALLVWDGAQGTWRTLTTNSAPPDAPAPLPYDFDDPVEIASLFYGPSEELLVAVASKENTAAGDRAQVALDYAELTVTYSR